MGWHFGLGAPRHQKVLARLVMDAGRVVPLWSLVAAVWEGDPPASAARLVRNAISDLRVAWTAASMDAGQSILTEGDGYRLRLGPGSVDAQRFEDVVDEAETALGQGDLRGAAALLRSALQLWRGSAFAGLAGPVFATAAARWEQRRPETLTTRSRLAYWQGVAGNPAGAAAAFAELLTDHLRVLGPDHPNTLAARRQLNYWQET